MSGRALVPVEGYGRVASPDVILSTEAFRPDERATCWREYICDVFVELDCPQIPKVGFNGRIATTDIGELRVSDVHAERQRVTRTSKRISRAEGEFCLVSIQEIGDGLVRQDGREAKLGPGSLAIYDSTRPYELCFGSEFQQTVLRVPRVAFSRRIVGLDQLTARAVDTRSGACRVAVAYISELIQVAPTLTPDMRAKLLDTALDLLAMSLAGLRSSSEAQLSFGQAALLRRLEDYIERNLGDPDLSVERVAAANQISRRYASALFANAGTTVGQWLWSRRLERCRADLIDPCMQSRTVGEIAFHWGFNDLSHFSRTFKRAYEMTPSEFRRRHVENFMRPDSN